MTYGLDDDEREERAAAKRELFADDMDTLARLATKFDERLALMLEKAEPQDRARLAATVNRFDTYIVAEELSDWAKELEAARS